MDGSAVVAFLHSGRVHRQIRPVGPGQTVVVPSRLPRRRSWCQFPAGLRHAGGMARGVVKFFKEEKGWGAITSSELPAGQDAFVHFSVIEGSGYRALHAGDVVDFDYAPARQDSFAFVATRSRRVASGPAPTLRRIGQQVVIAEKGTPDAPLTPRRHSSSEHAPERRN